MAEQTGIEWTDHTWNPWEGCTAVSPACDHCYAENITKRFGKDIWGAHASRRKTKTKPNVYKWNRKLESNAKREKVFVASMADVFDNHKSILPEWRNEIWQTIKDCDNLDFLLLTKRPQNIKRYLPEDWGDGYENVWLGATVENQKEADRRIPHLLAVSASVHFLSCEPLFEDIDLTDFLWDCHHPRSVSFPRNALDWIITGGESGHGARPSHPDWFYSLRDQCEKSDTPFFFKQWGNHDELGNKVGKKVAGRTLNGKLHDATPRTAKP